jgi:predicted homoserine dehydrogenase-like protein
MGRGFAAQLGRIPGMTLAAAFDIDPERARQACVASGAERVETDPGRAAAAIARGVPVALDDEVGTVRDELVVDAHDRVPEATDANAIDWRVTSKRSVQTLRNHVHQHMRIEFRSSVVTGYQ